MQVFLKSPGREKPDTLWSADNKSTKTFFIKSGGRGYFFAAPQKIKLNLPANKKTTQRGIQTTSRSQRIGLADALDHKRLHRPVALWHVETDAPSRLVVGNPAAFHQVGNVTHRPAVILRNSVFICPRTLPCRTALLRLVLSLNFLFGHKLIMTRISDNVKVK
jgi:hypothetical protein